MDYPSDLGRCITQNTDDHRESAFLFHVNSTLQCSNSLTSLHPMYIIANWLIKHRKVATSGAECVEVRRIRADVGQKGKGI